MINYLISRKFLPRVTVKGKDASDALTAVILSGGYVLKGKNDLFVDYWVAVPKALGHR